MVVLIIALLLMVAGCSRQPSDREVFQRAIAAGKSAGANTQWFIFNEIAKAQAEHGYYDDALQTSHRVDRYRDQLFVELVSTRAKSGDLSGARRMAEAATEPDEKSRSLEVIAIAQAVSGDVAGARETMHAFTSSFSQQSVLEAIGTSQAERGDLDGALKTAGEMKHGWSDGVLFAVAHRLRHDGDRKEAHRVALRITDRDMARNAEADAVGSSPTTDACDLAWEDAKSGKFNESLRRLEGTNCDCRTVAYIHEKGGDTGGAEQAMRSCPNSADVSAGMAELAKRSAAKGDITAALKFAESVHVTGADFEEGYLAPTLRDIARSWVKKDMNAALKWSEARPDGYQRAMSLLGVAEGMSSKQRP